MNWSELIRSFSVECAGGMGDPAVTDVAYDSRRVVPGAVYVAIPGRKAHGDGFIAQAVSQGAVAVVSQNAQYGCAVPWIQVKEPRRALGELARKLWDLKVYDMTLVGITGTNGKTTIAHLFRALFKHLGGEEKVWMFTTVGNYLGTQCLEAANTTPESADVFRLLGQAAVKPATVVMEVSSHALDLDRVAGLSYDCAVFTNLTQDHLDFHNTMSEYYQAKKKLFTSYLKSKGKAVVNVDDPWGERLVREMAGVDVVTYGTSHNATVRIANWSCDWTGTSADVITGGDIVHVHTRLVGLFNVYNMAALCAGAVALSIDLTRVQEVLATFDPVKGRMEKVPLDADFSVVVDYAHTPDAIENVLSTARALTKSRLVCVLGCGGDRDTFKRPLMAAAAARLSDEIVLTSDNPRSEKPETIIDQMLGGVPLDFPHWVIADRRGAIAKALEMARPGDCVLIAGKGHETYQEIKGIKHHFSDREVVEELWSGRPGTLARPKTATTTVR